MRYQCRKNTNRLFYYRRSTPIFKYIYRFINCRLRYKSGPLAAEHCFLLC